MPRPAIELQGVGLRHANGLQALDGVELRVEAGEFLCLAGPSGCGKSSLLKLIAGLWRPSVGRVHLDGRTPGDAPARQHLSFVFQEPTLMPWASVADNVALPLKLQGLAARERAPLVDATLHRVGLQDFARALPHELSGGMQMRASIARGLITQPRLLLLDEPFGALDEITRQQLDDALLDIWSAGELTAVFVTHSLSEAAYLGTRVCVMGRQAGRIAFEDAQAQPWPRPPDHRTSASFNERVRRLQHGLRQASEQPADMRSARP